MSPPMATKLYVQDHEAETIINNNIARNYGDLHREAALDKFIKDNQKIVHRSKNGINDKVSRMLCAAEAMRE